MYEKKNKLSQSAPILDEISASYRTLSMVSMVREDNNFNTKIIQLTQYFERFS